MKMDVRDAADVQDLLAWFLGTDKTVTPSEAMHAAMRLADRSVIRAGGLMSDSVAGHWPRPAGPALSLVPRHRPPG